MRFATALAAVLVLVPPALAQRAAEGAVTDAKTGEPLPGANVAVLGADGAVVGGTATNAEGRFSLRLNAVPAELAVRFLGFETARLTVDAATPMPLAVALRPSAQELGAVTVRPGEDPAVALMRRVIARVRGQRASLGPYAVTAYSRSTIFTPEGEVRAIREGVSDAYWAPGDGWREAVVATRATGNLRPGAAGPIADQLLDLLDADVEVQGHRLVGPTHPDALDVYDFELGPTSALDGELVVEVALRPRRATASAFEGTIQVLARTADVLAADLRPGPAFVFPPPIQITDARFRQQYVPVAPDSSLWLPADLQSGFAFGIQVDGLLSSDPFRIERASQLSGYRLGWAAPDSLRDGPAVQRPASPDSTRLAAPGVAPPLTAGEARAYAAGDSLGSVEGVLVLRGPLAGLARGNIRVTGGGRSGPRPPRPFFAASPSPGLAVNPVEGVRPELGLDLRLGSLRVAPRAGYGVLDGELSLGAEAWHPLARLGRARLSVVGEVSDGVDRRIAPGAPELAQGLASGRGGYHHAERASAGLRLAAGGLGRWNGAAGGMTQFDVDGALALRFQAERAVGLFRGEVDADLLPLAEPLVTRSLRLDGGLGTLGVPLGLLPRRALQVSAELAPGAWNDAGWWRAAATVDHRVVTFARRRALPMALDLRLAGGVSGGALPALRRFAVERGLGGTVSGAFGLAHTPFGTLRARTDVPGAGERYALAAWEHSFRTVPFEALGLDGLARRNYTLLVHGASARTWGGDEAAEAWHHEVGVSLSGVLGALRLDLTQRLDAPGTVLGVGVARAF